MTPEEKLCSRKWRLLNSAGVLWSILSFGLLTCVNFLVRGIKSQNRLWIIYGIGFAVLSVVVLSWSSNVNSGTKEAPVSTPESTAWGWVWFLSWIAGIVLSVMTNRKWLMWKAHHGNNRWYAQPATAYGVHNAGPGRQPQQQQVPPPWPHQAQVQQYQGQPYPPQAHPFQQPEYRGQNQPNYPMNPQSYALRSELPMGHRPQQVEQSQRALYVNGARAEDFAALGMDQTTAEKIVNTRDYLGGYRSFEHLLAATGLPPHILIPHRTSFTFEAPQAGRSTRTSDAPKPPAGGRTLDL
jgi:hypothetical protein